MPLANTAAKVETIQALQLAREVAVYNTKLELIQMHLHISHSTSIYMVLFNAVVPLL